MSNNSNQNFDPDKNLSLKDFENPLVKDYLHSGIIGCRYIPGEIYDEVKHYSIKERISNPTLFVSLNKPWGRIIDLDEEIWIREHLSFLHDEYNSLVIKIYSLEFCYEEFRDATVFRQFGSRSSLGISHLDGKDWISWKARLIDFYLWYSEGSLDYTKSRLEQPDGLDKELSSEYSLKIQKKICFSDN